MNSGLPNPLVQRMRDSFARQWSRTADHRRSAYMRAIFSLGWYLTLSLLIVGCKPSSSADSEAAQRERLFQRFLAEMRQSGALTNIGLSPESFDAPTIRRMFDRVVIHPSFGLHWDEVPPPTITGSNALDYIAAFIATNGWDLETNAGLIVDGTERMKPLRGLPWAVIQNREFPAVTHGGILYVMFNGWHHDCNGVAYNPNTNAFAPGIRGFKHIGQHWYVWAQPEFPTKLVQEYEGHKT